ncbi:MAG: hypothetical protein V4683_07425 [Bacteroidota bacterium]
MLIVLILVGIVASSLNTFLKPIIKKNLQVLVVEGSNNLYKFSLSDYTIGKGGRTVELKGFKIEVDSVRYFELKKLNLLPKLIATIKINDAKLTGLDALNLWRHNNIEVDDIVMSGAVIRLQQQKNDSVTTQPSKTLYEYIKKEIQSIKISHIGLKDADITFRTLQQETQQKDSWRFEKTSIKIDDIYVDSLSHNDTTRILYAGNIQLGFNKFKMKSTDGTHEFSISKTLFDFKKRMFILDTFKMRPSISQAEFNKKIGHEDNRLTITIPKVEFENFKASELFTDNNLIAKKIRINNPNILIFKDRTAGPSLVSKMFKYPHQILLNAKIQINIDSLVISNGAFTYSEKHPKTGRMSYFRFTRINGPLDNITNNLSKIASNSWCKARLNANFMGVNQMTALFQFDLAAKNGHFITDATLNSLSARHINPSLYSLAQVRAESFILNKLVYHIEGYDYKAFGNLKFLYSNLKLSVLKNDEGEIKKRGGISMLANLFVHNDNLPDENERKAINIKEKRITNKNFFNLICKTLISCLVQIVVKGDSDKKNLASRASKKKRKSTTKDSKL